METHARPPYSTVTLVVFALAFLCASAAPANSREWKNATVISVETTIVSTASWGDTNVVHYKIQTGDMIYVLEYAFNPAVKAPFPGQHTRSRSPNVTVNGKTKISIDGRNAHILDDDGKDVKLPIVEKIARPTENSDKRKSP